MKNLFSLCFALLFGVLGLAQTTAKADYGEGFDFNRTDEKEPNLILADSYNAYLLTYVNRDGMLKGHDIIVRKFDQKNQLTDTYKETFQNIDAGTLFNYVGSATMPGNNKQLIFTESYSGKSDKQNLYQHIFDKTTGKFTTTLVKSFPMESVNKKGVFDLRLSENNRYACIFNAKNSTKKEAVDANVLMIDVATATVLWTKDVPLDTKNTERSFTVTNSGKAVLVRADKGFKLRNFLTVVTADKAEDTELGENVILQDPKAISIGNQDYLIGFDYDAKGLRYGDFEKFMLYDIDAAKIINNNKMPDFYSLKDAKGVAIKNVFIQNNEFHIFAEARSKAGSRQTKVNEFSSMTFDEPYYKYGPAYLLVMDFEGKMKSTIPINVSTDAQSEMYSSFGLVNVKGDYRIIGSGSSIYKMSYNDAFKINSKENILFYPWNNNQDSGEREYSWTMVPSLFGYLNDSKKYIIGRMYNNKLSLITVTAP